MSRVPNQVNQKTAFGELTVANKDPEIQVSAQYNTSGEMRSVVSTGTTEIVGGEFVANSGTTANGFAAIFTDRQVIARPGQGSEILFTARFDEGLAGSRQSAGPSTASDSMFFAFEDEVFGIRFNHGGLVIIEELQITTPASGAESTTVTIDGTAFTVPITAGTVQHNAFEIAESLNTQLPLYRFTQNDDTVVARSVLAAAETGSFAFSSPGDAVGAWTQVSPGAAPDGEFTPQSQWSENQFPALIPTNINTYKIVHNGDVCYHILDALTNEYVLVHREIHTNTEQTPMFSTAAFRITWASQNLTNTIDHAVRGTFAAAFNQGEREQIRETESAFTSEVSAGTTAINILTIRCREVFGTKVHLGRFIPVGLSASTDGTKGAIIQVIKNAVFANETDYSYNDKATSIVEIDRTPSVVSGGKVLISIVITTGVSLGRESFKNLLLPGETLTIAMRVPSAAAADMNASLVWEEDL